MADELDTFGHICVDSWFVERDAFNDSEESKHASKLLITFYPDRRSSKALKRLLPWIIE